MIYLIQMDLYIHADSTIPYYILCYIFQKYYNNLASFHFMVQFPID